MKELSRERLGEIALLILKEKSRNERIPDIKDLKRNLGNASKTLGVSTEELFVLWVTLYSEIFSSVLVEAESITFEKEATQTPSPFKLVGEKIKGFLSFKK
jgi:hypothetical protein